MFKTKFSPCEITKKAKTWFTDIIDIVSEKSFVLTPNGLGLIKGVQSIFSSRNFLKRIETGLVLFYFQIVCTVLLPDINKYQLKFIAI